jgi:hypothetical protein
MDLIKQMMERRAALNIQAPVMVSSTTERPTPAEKVKQDKRAKSMRERRKEIIAEKPKNKVVKDYFEDLISELCYSSSEEE